MHQETETQGIKHLLKKFEFSHNSCCDFGYIFQYYFMARARKIATQGE